MKSKLQQLLTFYGHSEPYFERAGSSALPPLTIEEFYDSAAMIADVGNCPCTYLNNGIWNSSTTTRHQAGTNLMQTITDGISALAPNFPSTPTIVDVACGLGATTQYLHGRWPNSQILGINLTERQLSLCRRNAPGCEFKKMDATSLKLSNSSVDAIVCIEAAFQFRTRQKFLEETHRVLKPGGIFAATDVLVTRESHTIPHMFSLHHPPENQIDDISEYRMLLRAAGFTNIVLSDITEQGAVSYFRQYAAELLENWRNAKLAFSGLQRNLRTQYLLEAILSAQVLVLAVK